MGHHYYNTTDLVGDDLAERIANAASQENKVRRFFEAHPEKRFTPFEVKDAVFEGVPITSVRRAITNLTDEGVLEKLDNKRDGEFGEPNHLWQLNLEQPKSDAESTTEPEGDESNEDEERGELEEETQLGLFDMNEQNPHQ